MVDSAEAALRLDPEGEPAPGKAPDALLGRVVNDRFRITALLARGGMGKVYKAEQSPLGRQVALKILTPNYSGDGDPEFHKRFFLEASTCSKLSHPNTVTIFDYGRTDDDIYYIAMELLEGRTLHRALREDGPLGPVRTMHIARQVCRSLREAHALGVIHRDLKPANVFLVKHGDEKDFVKVLDFGLVKDVDGSGEDLTQTGLFMGSPKYMSPEQIKGERVDARADVYALGVIMYEMLTGKVPFDRPNSVNILMAHVHDAPPTFRDTNPGVEVPHALTDIVMCALAKDPDARFASMDAMLAALKDLASETGLSISRSTEAGLTSSEVVPLGNTGRFGAVGGPSDRPPPLGTTGSFPPVPYATVSGGAPFEGGGSSQPPPGFEASLYGDGPRSVETPRSRAPYWVAALGLLALVSAVVVALVLEGGDRGGNREDTSRAGAVEPGTERSSGVITTPDPAVVRTMVHLRSEPAGALVAVGDREYGPTPADVEWVGDDAERGREVRFVFRLPGHQDYPVTRVITGEALDVAARLEAIRAAPRPTGRPTGRRTGSRGGGPPVKGYKLDPY